MEEITARPKITTLDETLQFRCTNLPTGLKIDEVTGVISGKTPFTFSGNLVVRVSGERSTDNLVIIKISDNDSLKNNFCDAETRLSNYGSILYKRCDGYMEGIIRKDCSTDGRWNENTKDIQCYDDREVKEVKVRLMFQLNKNVDEVDISHIKGELVYLYEVLETQMTTKKNNEYLNVTIVYNNTELLVNNGLFLKVGYTTVLANHQLNVVWNDVEIDFNYIIVKSTTPEIAPENGTTTEKPGKSPTKINVGAIVGGILGLLLLIVIILIILWRRREDDKREKELARSKINREIK